MVIAILAVLVSIVAINVSGLMSGVNETAMATEKNLVQLAIDRYNTWDVTVDGAAPISPQPWLVQISSPLAPFTAPFAKYLSSPTRFYYSWAANGAYLTSSVQPY